MWVAVLQLREVCITNDYLSFQMDSCSRYEFSDIDKPTILKFNVLFEKDINVSIQSIL